MENPAMTWGIANILTDCGFDFLARGIYRLRAESYHHKRVPYPLFWWKAPSGKQVLTRWDLYQDTKSWGGYSEAYTLAAMAGEKWNAFEMTSVGDRNTPEVFKKRKQFIEQTIKRYEAYGDNYPISSILLLGTGWDNWTRTPDYSEFIRKFNADSDGSVRLVDARYEDFFLATQREIKEKNLTIPTLEGSFGICWEEWAAHLAGQTADFKQAQRMLRLAEASHALQTMAGKGSSKSRTLLQHGFSELLKFAEHDFGGTDRRRAAMSAGARASAVTQAMDIARSLAPRLTTRSLPTKSDFEPEQTTFDWRGGRVVFDPNQCGVVSLTDAQGRAWVSADQGSPLGQFKHMLYRSRAKPDSVFPEPLSAPGRPALNKVACRRSSKGVQILADFGQSGFHVESTWFFHAKNPWIDITCCLKDGWSDEPQTVEFCFPFAMRNPTYRYDAPGAILTAGPTQAGGDDLPGANPELYAGVTFAAASDAERTALLITPDSLLLRFGRKALVGSAGISSMPMMNLTGNDHQFGQGGLRDWTFRYRVVLLNEPFDPLQAVRESQQFAAPPFLNVPGQSPAVPGLEALDINFPAGPLLVFKVAEDNQRLILRIWNVLNRPAQGSLNLPPKWPTAEICDALERPLKHLPGEDGRAIFTADPLATLTVALTNTP
jgi:hypothetical protein